VVVAVPRRCTLTSPAGRRLASAPAALGTRPLVVFQPPAKALPTRTLLLADDSLTIHKLVSLSFAGEDVRVEAVTGGEEAIEKARSLRPDVIMADVFMPGKSGYEVCEAVKNDPVLSAIPVILLIGTLEPFDASEASRVGCDGHLTKPFDSVELVEMVRALAERGAAAAQSTPGGERRATETTLVSARTRESFLGSGSIL